MLFKFGACRLDLEARELRVDDQPVTLEPRAFDVLAHLSCNRERVVPKIELLDEIWGDQFVGDSALASQIKHVREAVGDDGRTQAVIRTAHRVGYRFIADTVGEERAAADLPTTADGSRSTRRSETGSTLTSLVGRDDALEHLERRLGAARCVTITGAGGVGKTSIATHLLDRVAGHGRGAAWVCELADTRSPDAVGNVILMALGQGQHTDADPGESVLRTLQARSGVLLLDNCEHVIDTIGSFALAILERCPGIRLVVTSRIPLGIAGESIYDLPTLSTEAAKDCFVAFATSRGADVDSDDPALERLCERLDGLPLALELAAARARLLSPSDMLTFLDDRFGFLRDTSSGDDERHQSLHRAIAWSWDALDAPDRRLLTGLSVFVGTFTAREVGAVAMPDASPLEVVDAIGRLVDHSLVVSTPNPSRATRFRLLDSVRDFAAARAVDPEGLRRRFVTHYVDLSEALDAMLQTERLEAAIESTTEAWGNIRAAVDHAACRPDVHSLRRLIRAVGPYAGLYQIYEVLDWCEHAELNCAEDLESGNDTADIIAADAMAIKACMLARRGREEISRRLAAIAYARHESYGTLLTMIWCAYYDGDLEFVEQHAPRLIELCRSDTGFDRGFADGFAAIAVGVQRKESDLAVTASPAEAELGLMGTLRCFVDGLRVSATDPDRAAELLEAVVETSTRDDYRLLLAAASSHLTNVALPHLEPDDAMESLREVLQVYIDRGLWTPISSDIVMAARLLTDAGDTDTAVRLLGARGASGYSGGMSERLRLELHAELEPVMGERFAELADQGALWSPPEAAKIAIDALGRVLAPV